MAAAEVVAARSWLFAPGDSERKMSNAILGTADAIILDLEDSVAQAAKPKARQSVASFVAAHAASRARLWVRINSLQSQHALADLVAVVQSQPAGIMLPKARGRGDVEVLHNYLTALEAAAGIPPGLLQVVVIGAETPAGMLACADYAGAPRLVAMTWGAEDLAAAVGAIHNRAEDGGYDFTYQLARSLCLVGASAAGVSAIETVHLDFNDDAGLREVALAARRAGFRGMLAIHPRQVEIINQAFAPTAREVAAAQEIVELFAAKPDAGAIGKSGAMFDLPHLKRAMEVLARAARR